MSTAGVADSRGGRVALLALAAGAFVIGSAELLIVGILDLVARATNISVSTAGIHHGKAESREHPEERQDQDVAVGLPDDGPIVGSSRDGQPAF